MGLFNFGKPKDEILEAKLQKLTDDIEIKKVDLAKLEQQIKKVKEVISLDTELTQKRNELAQLNEEIAVANGNLNLQEFGFFERQYSFSDSTKYKDKLDSLRMQQKSMVKNGTAGRIITPMLLNNSKSKGKAMQNQLIKAALRGFNGEADALLVKVSVVNVDNKIKALRKVFEQLNKMYSRNLIEITYPYLDLKIEELRLAAEYELQKPEDGGGFLKKAIENTEKTPFNQLASTKYPEVDLPTVGSMVAIWADRPSAEYKEEEIFELMTAFADHNKDYFRADYKALREELAQIPENLEGYSTESLDALKAAKEALNYNLNRNKQAELDTLVANLKAARLGLKPAATHSGSLDESETSAAVENRPELITRTEEIPFETVKKENPNLPAGQEKVVTEGAKGERTIYVSVTTENGKETETVLEEKVTKEAANQVVEVGTPVTHVGDEEGVAPVADAKPRVVIEDEEIPFTTITRETNQLPKGQSRVVTEGVKGRRSHFYSVTTAADGSEVKTLATSVVAQEPVTQIVEVGTPVTHVGDEKGVAPVADEKPRVVIEDEEISFTTITRETDALPKGETRVVTEGVKGRRSHFYSVSTAADGSEVKTLVTSVVAQEPVTQIIEIGTPVTHVGDEKGLAPIAEEKPALEIPNAPAPVAEEKPKLEIPSKPAPATVPAEENKALPQAPAPVAKENKLPETGSQGSEWLIATGLMAALTAYGLSKKKD